MKRSDIWLPEYWKKSPLFSDHQALIGDRQWQSWPDCNELNRLWPEEIKTLSGKILRFKPQSLLDNDARYYEEHIYATGEIPTRDHNWHDFFNAMVWLQFPEIKSVINAQHVAEIELQIDKHRSRKRDALTLFDESGVIFTSNDDEMIEALRNHDWKTLFWEKRTDWWRTTSVFIFGHGLYEKILAPYVGMTANALTVHVNENFFRQARCSQIRELDQLIGKQLIDQDRLQIPSELTPLPILGIPDCWIDNNDASFYENRNYFRPKKS